MGMVWLPAPGEVGRMARPYLSTHGKLLQVPNSHGARYGSEANRRSPRIVEMRIMKKLR